MAEKSKDEEEVTRRRRRSCCWFCWSEGSPGLVSMEDGGFVLGFGSGRGSRMGCFWKAGSFCQ